jgi:hypothetical protein
MIAPGRWVERKTLRGFTFRVLRAFEPVPRIEQQYLDCSIYLYSTEEAARAGKNAGGSGFLVSVREKPPYDAARYPMPRDMVLPPEHIYAVTNNHVARRGFPIIRLNRIDGEQDVYPLEHGDWIPHPDGDDLAVVPIDLEENQHRYYAVNSWSFVKKINAFDDYGAGDDTFMVGRFFSHSGKQRNTPSLRFGNIAMLPFEKVRLDDGFMQEAFLVETRSISGFSGSPVFVYEAAGASIETDRGWQYPITDLVGRPRLLGIDCGHVPKHEWIIDSAGNPHADWKVNANTGMAIVIPAWRLDDLFYRPEFVMQRKQKEEEDRKKKEAEETVVSDVEEPLTRESYEDVLRRASRRVSEPGSGKTRTSE